MVLYSRRCKANRHNRAQCRQLINSSGVVFPISLFAYRHLVTLVTLNLSATEEQTFKMANIETLDHWPPTSAQCHCFDHVPLGRSRVGTNSGSPQSMSFTCSCSSLVILKLRFVLNALVISDTRGTSRFC